MNPSFHIDQFVLHDNASGAKQLNTQELPPSYLDQQIAALLHRQTLHGIAEESGLNNFGHLCSANVKSSVFVRTILAKRQMSADGAADLRRRAAPSARTRHGGGTQRARHAGIVPLACSKKFAREQGDTPLHPRAALQCTRGGYGISGRCSADAPSVPAFAGSAHLA